MDVQPVFQPDFFSHDALQEEWRYLNQRHFAGLLPPIAIQWSTRLTSSVGLFVSRGGPRTRSGLSAVNRREIRLSLPLLERLARRIPFVEQEVRNTLAHEMIHQWQFDILRRRPNHGLDFLRKMAEMNRSGEVVVTTYHTLRHEVLALSRFAWRCQTCGLVYRRQRNTINPRRHQCGRCHGALLEYQADDHSPLLSNTSVKRPLAPAADTLDGQLTLAFPATSS